MEMTFKMRPKAYDLGSEEAGQSPKQRIQYLQRPEGKSKNCWFWRVESEWAKGKGNRANHKIWAGEVRRAR